MSDHYRSEGAHLAEGEDQFREEGGPPQGVKKALTLNFALGLLRFNHPRQGDLFAVRKESLKPGSSWR